MNETRSMVKSALGLILALVVVVGGIYGFNVKVEVQDTEVEAQETTAVEAPKATTATVAQTTDDESEATQPVATQEPMSTTVSTPVVDEQPDVDNSADTEVTEPTEEEQTVTEGEVENA